MKIGVDFDDVVLDCNTSLALFHNSRYGTSYQRSDITSWYLDQTWGCTQEEVAVRIKEWYGSQEHMRSEPMPGAREAIGELAQSHELHIVTSRPTYVRELTSKWLEKHFPRHFTELHFTSHFEPGAGSKAEVCRNLGISLLIEDSLVHARDVAASGLTVLLFDSPWNQEPVADNITRVYSWREALDLIRLNNET